jgi:glutaredoxin
MGEYELVMYTRTTPCPFVSLAKRVLEAEAVTYRELFIDREKTIEQRVLDWTGFLSVPTLIIARPGEDLPYTDFAELPKDASPRGVDRGPMITEPSEEQLKSWLRHYGLLAQQPTTA